MSPTETARDAAALPDLRSWSVRAPIGTWFLIATDADVPKVTAATLTSIDDAVARLSQDEAQRYRGPSRKPNPAVTAVRDYFDGRLDALDDIAVHQPGAHFTQQVWWHMRGIAPSTVLSYAELATCAGSPNAVRAVGSACARNRIPLIVPCHRVVPSGGGVGNYYYGIDIKQRLLAHEGWRGQ